LSTHVFGLGAYSWRQIDLETGQAKALSQIKSVPFNRGFGGGV